MGLRTPMRRPIMATRRIPIAAPTGRHSRTGLTVRLVSAGRDLSAGAIGVVAGAGGAEVAALEHHSTRRNRFRDSLGG